MAAKKRSLIDKMADNPQDDWTIADVRKLCSQHNLEFREGSGSHSVVSSPHLRDSLTIPSRRPIKTFYIKTLVGFVHAHQNRCEDQDE